MSQQLTHRITNTTSAYPPWWTVSDVYVCGNKTLTRGTGLTIRGERGGLFKFWDHVIAPPRPGSGKRKTVEWITVVGGSRGVAEFRSFRPDRIGRVLADKPKRKRRKADR